MTQAFSRQIAAFLSVSRVRGQSLTAARLSNLSRGGWKRAVEWLDDGGLTLTWWNHLKETGQKARTPPEVRTRLEQNCKDHHLRVAQMLSEFGVINTSFEAAGIPYVVLKGFALIPGYCPDIFLRPSYDYDYLVDPESVSAADRALKDIGFIRRGEEEDHPIVYVYRDRHARRTLTRDELYSATLPRTIELHFRFWDPDTLRLPLAVPTDLLARREARELSNPACSGPPVRYYALSREDELAFQALHVFRHILRNWCRLCSLLDIAYFLEHSAADGTFWSSFLARLNNNQPLTNIVGIVFLLAASVFGATIPEPVSAQIVVNLPRPLTLWVERYGIDSALSNFADNKFSLFLHREFIRDDACWRQIRQARLFPIHRPNRAFQMADPRALARLGARWNQLIYIIRRLNHHLAGTIRYGFEAPFWARARRRTKGICRGSQNEFAF